jgi:hypothetical protein
MFCDPGFCPTIAFCSGVKVPLCSVWNGRWIYNRKTPVKSSLIPRQKPHNLCGNSPVTSKVALGRIIDPDVPKDCASSRGVCTYHLAIGA